MTLDSLKKLASASGFSVVCKPGDLVCIPPVYIVLTASIDGQAYVRWSTYERDDHPEVMATIDLLFRSHSFLEKTDYKHVQDALNAVAAS